MALEWIKITCDLPDKWQVLALRRALKVRTAYEVVGMLVKLWAHFENHTRDGKLPGLVADDVDLIIGRKGFAAALAAVGWLKLHEGGGVEIPAYEEYMGAAARKREEDTERKRREREAATQGAASGTTAGHPAGQVADRPRTGRGRPADKSRTEPGRKADKSVTQEREIETEGEGDLERYPDRDSSDRPPPQPPAGEPADGRTDGAAGGGRGRGPQPDEAGTGGGRGADGGADAGADTLPFDPLRANEKARKAFEGRWRAAGLKPFSRLSPSLQKHLEALLLDPWWAEHYPAALERAGRVAFLRDGTSRRNGRYDVSEFLRDADEVRKLVDGVYDPAPPSRASPPARGGPSLVENTRAALEGFLQRGEGDDSEAAA